MPKHFAYILMSVCLLGFSKLIQVLVFDDSYEKRPKKIDYDLKSARNFFEEADKIEDQNARTKTKEVGDASKTELTAEEASEGTFTENTETWDDFTNEIPASERDEAEKKLQTATKSKIPVSEVVSTEKGRSYGSLEELKEGYLAPILARLPANRSRGDIIIRYYRHLKDGDGVYALKELGYYIHEKIATETKGLGSNVLYYGDHIRLEDIQIVAYTLKANGIPLKAIMHTKYAWKADAIEIGTDSTLLSHDIISDEAIMGFETKVIFE